MKFGISYQTAAFGVEPDQIMAFAQHAEACGFESLYLPEHIALFVGAKIGTWEMPPSLPYADPLDTLTFVAAATERILLGTSVLQLPFHHPVTLAKRLATIDVPSKGRMRLLTVGLGSLPGEAAAVGVEFASRGRRADEAIDVMRLLWAGGDDGVSFDGEFFAFDNLVQFPKPHQVARLPIHIAGSSRAAAVRAGQRGDGYFPGGALTPAQRASQLDLVLSTATSAGRDPDVLEYTRFGSIDMSAEGAEARAAQSVTRIVVSTSSADLAQQRDEMSAFAERLGLPVASTDP